MTAALDASTPGMTDGMLHPSIRRAVRRVLAVRSPIVVRMRAVPCPVAAPSSNHRSKLASPLRFGGGGVATMDDPNEQRGLVMCVEVEGSGGRSHDPAEDVKDEGFEIESVDVEIAGSMMGIVGGSGRGDVEIKPIGQGGEDDDLGGGGPRVLPLVLGPNEQHNFLYAVTVAPDAAQDHDVGFVRSVSSVPLPPPIPVVVATSPSQRFTARFGDEATEAGVERARDRDTKEATQASASATMRNVTIVVRGRPVKMLSSKAPNGRNLTGGYMVDDEASRVPMSMEPNLVSSTASFASKWNTTLDVSSFAYRAPPKRATFEQRERANPFALPPAVAAATARTARQLLNGADPPNLRSTNRASTLNEIETVAGSKRHTMASLAALVAKSPAMARVAPPTGTVAATTSDSPRNSMQTSRALPSVPANESRRYFSLPAGPGSPNPAYRSKSPFHPTSTGIPRSATPPPGSYRNSFPINESPKWVPGSRSVSAAATMADSPRPMSQEVPANVAKRMMMTNEYTTTTIDHGQILVSVSLMPLRAIKKPNDGSAVEETPTNGEQGLGVDDLDDARQARGSPRTSFKFPSPSSSPALPSSTSSPRPGANGENVEPGAPRYRAPKVGLLDVFLVEVFVVNRSDQVKRFTVGVPAGDEASQDEADVADGKKAWYEYPASGSTTTSAGGRAKTKVASLVALENDVRIGPLVPRSCASVTLRFLAIRPGAHPLTELRLVDLATGLETRLNNPLSVVVEA